MPSSPAHSVHPSSSDAPVRPADRLPDDTAAFAASPPSVPAVATPAAAPSLSPSLSPRKCESCHAGHPGTYGSGRFCSATCAKKVGARHKWAARAAAPGGGRRLPAARRHLADAPCESCAKPHDRSYGSGRFCSVHCARRVAATKKWEKSRTEKSKRLEAIRPAMLPLSPTQSSTRVIAGKRRRVVPRTLDQLHISDSSLPFYSPPSTYMAPTPAHSGPQPMHLAPASPSPTLPSRNPVYRARQRGVPMASASPALSVAPPTTSYLRPQALSSVHYAMHTPSLHLTHADMPLTTSSVMYGPHHLAPPPRGHPTPQSVFYTQVQPTYRLLHPGTQVAFPESATFSSLSQSPSPPPTCTLPMAPASAVQYAQMANMGGPVHPNYALARGAVFEMEAVSVSASPTPGEEPSSSNAVHVKRVESEGSHRSPNSMHDGRRGASERNANGQEGSENAARALLCLRETNSRSA